MDRTDRLDRGDPENFIAQVERHRQAMYKVARSYFSETMDVEDAIADTILSCWENLSALKRPDKLKAWLLRVLINKCNDIKRRQARVIPVETLPERPVQDPDPGNLSFESLIAPLDEQTRARFVLSGIVYGEEQGKSDFSLDEKSLSGEGYVITDLR